MLSRLGSVAAVCPVHACMCLLPRNAAVKAAFCVSMQAPNSLAHARGGRGSLSVCPCMCPTTCSRPLRETRVSVACAQLMQLVCLCAQVPYRLLKAFHRIQGRLVRELEKKFSGRDVVVIATRRILPPVKNGNSKSRPRSRTLTAVRLLACLCSSVQWTNSAVVKAPDAGLPRVLSGFERPGNKAIVKASDTDSLRSCHWRHHRGCLHAVLSACSQHEWPLCADVQL